MPGQTYNYKGNNQLGLWCSACKSDGIESSEGIMQGLPTYQFRAARYVAISALAASSLLFGQDTQYPAPNDQQAVTNSGGWKRVGDAAATPSPQAGQFDPNQGPPPAAGDGPNAQPSYSSQGGPQGGPYANGQPGYQQQPAYQQQPGYQQPGYQQPNYQAAQVPPSLTIPAGTFLTVRVNQLLSTDKNQAGDAFSASLVQPVVVNGVVVAEPGQTVGGRVTESQKAGRIEGTARLGIQLTELTLVDGQQLPVQSALVSRQGSTSVGRDAGAIATTTGLGAAIGAGADWGRGAAIGAGAGAAAGIIGVLVTRGHPSVIYPEQVLTFRIDTPLTLSTERAPQAFRYVQANEYERPYGQGMETQPAPYGPYAAAGPYPAAPAYPAYPSYYYASPYPYYGYGYGYYPYYSGFSLFLGGRGYYGRGYYGGGYGRGYYGGRGGFVGGGFRGGAVRGGGHR
jgi:hypothetical protein